LKKCLEENNFMKILIVDDEAKIRTTLVRILNQKGYELAEASDGEAAIKIFHKFEPDMLLLDVMMPKLNGWEVCKKIRSIGSMGYVYIIMLTAMSESNDELSGFDVGADDYVTKPFNPKLLLARIKIGLESVYERNNANMDALTGLYNRRMMDRCLAEEMSRNKRYKHNLSLIMVDIDHFKNINDNFGHKTGDLVLQEFSKLLKQHVRLRIDLPFRYGGEEFILLLPETDKKGAFKIAERFRKKINEHTFPRIQNLTISAGVASVKWNDNMDLLELADEALYQAKKNGRNRVVQSNPG